MDRLTQRPTAPHKFQPPPHPQQVMEFFVLVCSSPKRDQAMTAMNRSLKLQPMPSKSLMPLAESLVKILSSSFAMKDPTLQLRFPPSTTSSAKIASMHSSARCHRPLPYRYFPVSLKTKSARARQQRQQFHLLHSPTTGYLCAPPPQIFWRARRWLN